MTLAARYDGYADWYDSWNQPNAERNAPEVRDLFGPGEGLCLDLGCGSGHYFDVITATGRTVVGLDYSADQLRIARGRSARIVRGDAAALPFADCSFPAVATMWISTDVDDFGAVLAEAARVLVPGGLLVFYGAHPCFNGPHVQWMDDGGMRATPPTGSPDGTSKRRGGVNTSAGESGCAIIRWPTCLTRSSARDWRLST